MPACHAGGHEFESRTHRQPKSSSKLIGELSFIKYMMKKLFVLLFLVCAGMMNAQEVTKEFTVYKNFKPGVIHMANGRDLKNPLLNIFMKNSSLLYVSGTYSMEANMDNVLGVDFDDRQYIKIEGKLAYFVDSVGANKLYCVTLIDMDAYKSLMKNNVNISNLSLGDQISYSTIDLEQRDSIQMPVIDIFYYLFEGKFVRVHERELSRILPKEKKRLYKTIISQDNFSWLDKKSLMQLLKFISTMND